MPQPRRFPSAAKRELTPPGSACQQLFFKPRSFFRGAPEDFSPAQKRELIPTPSRCQQLFSVYSKNRHRAFTATTQQLQVVFNSQPKHLHTLPQTPPSVNHFLIFSKIFSFQYPTFLFYCTMRIYASGMILRKKGPESGLSGPSHQVA